MVFIFQDSSSVTCFRIISGFVIFPLGGINCSIRSTYKWRGDSFNTTKRTLYSICEDYQQRFVGSKYYVALGKGVFWLLAGRVVKMDASYTRSIPTHIRYFISWMTDSMPLWLLPLSEGLTQIVTRLQLISIHNTLITLN